MERTYDYLVIFTSPSVKMKLTDDGWVSSGLLNVEKDKINYIYNNFFTPSDSWPKTMYSKTDEMEFSVYFSEDSDNKVESIQLRIDLKPMLSKERVLEISNLIIKISKELELVPFNVYSGKIMKNVNEVFWSICECPKAVQYGYSKYSQ